MQQKLGTDRSEAIRALRESWRVDYSAARARALSWLGDRYLLARPINRRPPSRTASRRLEVAQGLRPESSVDRPL